MMTRLEPIDTTASNYDRPLIQFDMSHFKGQTPTNVRDLPEGERLKHDALQVLVELECEVVETGQERTHLHDLVHELKLRLYGSDMAGF
jgi:hypothetical protein